MNLEVICSFQTDGKIIPLRFKLEENNNRYTYTIKQYKAPKAYHDKRNGYLGRPYITTDILDFECKIDVFGFEKIVTLRYFVKDTRWTIGKISK